MTASGSATASSATSSAAACCCTSSTAPASTPARPTRRCGTSSRPTATASLDKVEIVALNKADALTPEQLKQQLARLKRAAKKTPLVLSAATRAGITEVLRALYAEIAAANAGSERRPPRRGIP